MSHNSLIVQRAAARLMLPHADCIVARQKVEALAVE